MGNYPFSPKKDPRADVHVSQEVRNSLDTQQILLLVDPKGPIMVQKNPTKF